MTKQFDNFADLITFTRASTGTFLDSDGLLKTATTNTPRIEFDINGNRKGILIEEARTNLIERSVEFDNAYWNIVVGVSRTANTAIAPDGTLSGDTISITTVGDSRLQRNTTVANDSATYCASVFVKKTTSKSYNMRLKLTLAGGTGVLRETDINTETGEVSGTHIGVVSDFGDWWRVSLTITNNTSGNTSITLQIYPAPPNSDIGSSNEFWGAQLELGSFPTSYIPTAGAAATRSADVASIPTSAFGYNADKGTVVVDFSYSLDIFDTRAFSLDDGSTNNIMALSTNSAGSVGPYFEGRANSLAQFALTGEVPSQNANFSVAAAYRNNDFAQVVGGGVVRSSSLGDVPTVTTLAIGSRTGAARLNGHIKSIRYWPRRLTNSQLQRLTS